MAARGGLWRRNRAETGVGLRRSIETISCLAFGPPGWWRFLPPWPPPGKGRHMGPLAASAGLQLARKSALLLSCELAGNQGWGLCGLQPARTADLVGCHLCEGDICSWPNFSHASCHATHQEVKVERNCAWLPAWEQPETRSALLHKSLLTLREAPCRHVPDNERPSAFCNHAGCTGDFAQGVGEGLVVHEYS